MVAQTEIFRDLPAVDALLRDSEIVPLVAEEGQAAVADACRIVLARLRNEIAVGHLDAAKLKLALTGIHAAVREELRRSLEYSLRPVINATGVILHTNLGRAPLAPSAIEHVRKAAETYSNLEFDIDSGERGKRDVHVDRLFRRLLSEGLEHGAAGVPAPARSSTSTIVVNNNAAAVLLALNTLAEDGEVIVSRGELVEIGGSFRIPDVMAKSGAILREVGTTNRTRIADYERVINERTKLLLRVHRSNFEISGFTERPEMRELVALAEKHKLPLMEDLGSGALFDLRAIGINDEPGVLDSFRAGVHVVTYSGDKLLGGPQAGLISGREDLVKRMRTNSLFRALRVDKLTYAALEATLLAYIKRNYDAIPALRMMQMCKAEISGRAANLVSTVNDDIHAELIDGESLIGGGSAPSATLPTTIIALSSRTMSAETLSARLRFASPPVVARVEDGRVLLDLRTVFPEQDERVREILAGIAAN
ncbi:MAG TPA: L-seryl-tRNA(Sec) selenium transferase [Terriglobales bacterium]|jgi:L-seryl-tRNA(Ser) seleniumtransferase